MGLSWAAHEALRSQESAAPPVAVTGDPALGRLRGLLARLSSPSAPAAHRRAPTPSAAPASDVSCLLLRLAEEVRERQQAEVEARRNAARFRSATEEATRLRDRVRHLEEGLRRHESERRRSGTTARADLGARAPERPADPYAALFLSPDLPDDLLLRLHKALKKSLHPDLASGPDRAAAHRRFQAMQQAFASASARRGLRPEAR